MRILVTGGAGFIGSHLCRALLDRGHQVVCVDNLHLGRREFIAPLEGRPEFTFYLMDVLDRPALTQILTSHRSEAVFHMAANSDIQQGSSDHTVDLDLTFRTTYETLEAMLAADVRRLVFASTSAVVGETPEAIHEDFGPLQPISFYGAAKLASEAYISVFVDNYGFRATVLRFPNVVGENPTHGAVYDFINRLRQDPSHLDVLGDGSQNKPYLYVQDLVEAMLLAFEADAAPLAVYNVAGEGLTSVREIAEMVMQEMGLDPAAIRYGSDDRGWLGDVPFFHYDTSRIRALGWRPRHGSTDAVRLAVRRILGKA